MHIIVCTDLLARIYINGWAMISRGVGGVMVSTLAQNAIAGVQGGTERDGSHTNMTHTVCYTPSRSFHTHQGSFQINPHSARRSSDPQVRACAAQSRRPCADNR